MIQTRVLFREIGAKSRYQLFAASLYPIISRQCPVNYVPIWKRRRRKAKASTDYPQSKLLASGYSVITMWKYSSFPYLLSAESTFPLLLKDSRCLSCQFRGVGGAISFPRRYASNSNDVKKTTASSESSKKSPEQEQQKTASGASSDGEEFTPLMLDRPIGLLYPPQEGQNTGVDTRTLRQRRDDFVNYEKHLQRRKELYDPMSITKKSKIRESSSG